VKIDGEIHGRIGTGFLVLVGVCDADTEKEADKLAGKIARMRIFEDDAGKMNLSLDKVGGQVLSISQFTLYADCHKGNRPSFDQAGKPDHAKQLYLYFNDALRAYGIHVEEGIFGADMKVRLLNDGPVTITMDSAEILKGTGKPKN
jgi:D-tyrosyl-tRNA(Tyr) deacylase